VCALDLAVGGAVAVVRAASGQAVLALAVAAGQALDAATGR
jgi:hypothetical protein